MLQESVGTITSSPLFKGFFLLKNKDATETKFAEEPELTITANLQPKNFANLFSNSLTYFPL